MTNRKGDLLISGVLVGKCRQGLLTKNQPWAWALEDHVTFDSPDHLSKAWAQMSVSTRFEIGKDIGAQSWRFFFWISTLVFCSTYLCRLPNCLAYLWWTVLWRTAPFASRNSVLAKMCGDLGSLCSEMTTQREGFAWLIGASDYIYTLYLYMHAVGLDIINDICTILIDFVYISEARQLDGCGHTFHRSCIDLWLFRRADCPLCKTEAD